MTLSFDWPRAYEFEHSTGHIKQENSDFIVIEQLPESPSGEGEHLWLEIQKEGQNTAWVARQLAKWANLKPRDVSYAGLKDRHAVTQQTFSVHLPGKTAPSPHLIHIEGVSLINAERHSRKLKTGQLIGNSFKIRVRNCSQPIEVLAQNWQQIVANGVPNYFGPQRFGRAGQNVTLGMEWLLGKAKPPRQHQSIYLSAVRSYLFNTLLAHRVHDCTWSQLIDHEFAQFSEGKAGFYVQAPDQNDRDRCAEGKLSPCASLPGFSKDEFEALDAREMALLTEYEDVINALLEKKVMRHFRKLRVIPEQPKFETIEGDPVFSFFLPAGSYATSVLNEIIRFNPIAEAKDWNE